MGLFSNDDDADAPENDSGGFGGFFIVAAIMAFIVGLFGGFKNLFSGLGNLFNKGDGQTPTQTQNGGTSGVTPVSLTEAPPPPVKGPDTRTTAQVTAADQRWKDSLTNVQTQMATQAPQLALLSNPLALIGLQMKDSDLASELQGANKAALARLSGEIGDVKPTGELDRPTVTAIQDILREGFGYNVPATGVADAATFAAIEQFKKDKPHMAAKLGLTDTLIADAAPRFGDHPQAALAPVVTVSTTPAPVLPVADTKPTQTTPATPEKTPLQSLEGTIGGLLSSLGGALVSSANAAPTEQPKATATPAAPAKDPAPTIQH